MLENNGDRPLNNDLNIPITQRATALAAMLPAIAARPDNATSGTTGSTAPTEYGTGPGDQPGEAGQDHGPLTAARAGDPHEQTEIGNEAIVRAENGGS